MAKTKPSGRFSRYPAVNRDNTTKPVAKPTSSSPDLADMTVAEVVEWVGDDPDRRATALAAEASGKQRKGVTDALGA
jgi:hypothetical protein